MTSLLKENLRPLKPFFHGEWSTSYNTIVLQEQGTFDEDSTSFSQLFSRNFSTIKNKNYLYVIVFLFSR